MLGLYPEPIGGSRINLAYLEVFRDGNLSAAKTILQNIPPPYVFGGMVVLARWDMAMLERDYIAAEKIVTDFPSKYFLESGDCPKTFYQGRTALARGDSESAQRYFAATVPVLEGAMRKDPEDPEGHADLGLLYAYMDQEDGCHSRRSPGG